MNQGHTVAVPQPADTTRPMILPGSTIGMLGGGQLGRMFALSAAALGYRVVSASDHEESPASAVSHGSLHGDLSDPRLLAQLAQASEVVTLEFENIPLAAVEQLASRVPVRPSADVLRVAQDRALEKQTLAGCGLPVTPFQLVGGHQDLQEAMRRLGQPVVLKTTRDGYDGKGQWKIRGRDDLQRLLDTPAEAGGLDFDKPLIAEQWIDFEREVSVIVARSRSSLDGPWEVAVYPVFENQHANHILELSRCPARITEATEQAGRQMAIAAAEALGLCGLLCIEFFVMPGGDLIINEIAPRPHNSGHLTIEACQTSQFEQQVRAVCGLPLGDPSLIVPAAAMVNVLGQAWTDGPPDWAGILRIPGAHLHLYDKRHAKPGRKMGHVTLIGPADALSPRIARVKAFLNAGNR